MTHEKLRETMYSIFDKHSKSYKVINRHNHINTYDIIFTEDYDTIIDEMMKTIVHDVLDSKDVYDLLYYQTLAGIDLIEEILLGDNE